MRSAFPATLSTAPIPCRRIEVITSFYKHPGEMIVNSLIGSVLVYTILGLSLEVLDLYFANSRTVIGETLRNDALPPLGRLRAFIDANITTIRKHDAKNGCLVGNFAAEASDHSEIIRHRVSAIYTEIREAVAYCLKAAVKARELPKGLKISEVADFIVTGLQGAWLVSKVERDLAHAENFKKVLFSTVLA